MKKVRVLVLATRALDRRAIGAAVHAADELELVATCASPSSARDRVLRDVVDVLIADFSNLDAGICELLGEVAREHAVSVVGFDPAPEPETTATRAIEQLRVHAAPPPRTPPHVAEGPSTADREGATAPRPADLVAIGSSTGGPEALAQLISRLPSDFPAAVLVAQHMPASFTPILARRLEQRSRLVIHEAADGEPIRPGTVLIAPGDFHLEVDLDGRHVHLNQNPPENSCRPAADVLFRSVAQAFGPRALALVLTGMGRDGLEGARALRGAGAEVWVQDEDSSVVWGMPGLVHREGLSTHIGDLEELARRMLERGRHQRTGSVIPEPVRNP